MLKSGRVWSFFLERVKPTIYREYPKKNFFNYKSILSFSVRPCWATNEAMQATYFLGGASCFYMQSYKIFIPILSKKQVIKKWSWEDRIKYLMSIVAYISVWRLVSDTMVKSYHNLSWILLHSFAYYVFGWNFWILSLLVFCPLAVIGPLQR